MDLGFYIIQDPVTSKFKLWRSACKSQFTYTSKSRHKSEVLWNIKIYLYQNLKYTYGYWTYGKEDFLIYHSFGRYLQKSSVPRLLCHPVLHVSTNGNSTLKFILRNAPIHFFKSNLISKVDPPCKSVSGSFPIERCATLSDGLLNFL